MSIMKEAHNTVCKSGSCSTFPTAISYVERIEIWRPINLLGSCVAMPHLIHILPDAKTEKHLIPWCTSTTTPFLFRQ